MKELVSGESVGELPTLHGRAQEILAASNCIRQWVTDTGYVRLVESSVAQVSGGFVHLVSPVEALLQPPTTRPLHNGANPEPVTIVPGGVVEVVISDTSGGPGDTEYVIGEDSQIAVSRPENPVAGSNPDDTELARYIGSVLEAIEAL